MKKTFPNLSDAGKFISQELIRRNDYSFKLWEVSNGKGTFVTDRFEDVLVAFAQAKSKYDSIINIKEYKLSIGIKELTRDSDLWREVFLNHDKIKNELVLSKCREGE